MKISREGLSLIKKYEGLRLKAYKAHPSEKYFTIGYGHYGKDVEEKQQITEQQAEVLLIKDVAKFEEGIENIYKELSLKLNLFDALIVMAFNCGLGAVSLTLFKLIKAGDKEKIAAWWKSHYITCGGQVLKGLQKRRAEEAELFIK